MFRRDNNGQTTLNRTILNRAIRYRIALCDDSDLCFCYHLLIKILALKSKQKSDIYVESCKIDARFVVIELILHLHYFR